MVGLKLNRVSKRGHWKEIPVWLLIKLFKSLVKQTTKKTTKLRIIDPFWGNPSVPDEIPRQGAINAESWKVIPRHVSIIIFLVSGETRYDVGEWGKTDCLETNRYKHLSKNYLMETITEMFYKMAWYCFHYIVSCMIKHIPSIICVRAK